MSQKYMVAKLKKDVASNPALNAILHMFALRKRARASVTLRVLTRSMLQEGFKYTADECAAALKALSDAGVGTLESNSKGHVRALKDIKVTLQSLGKAVCGKEPVPVNGFKAKRQYQKVATPRIMMGEVPAYGPIQGPPTELNLVIKRVGGRHDITIRLPEDMTQAEIAGLIHGIQNR